MGSHYCPLQKGSILKLSLCPFGTLLLQHCNWFCTYKKLNSNIFALQFLCVFSIPHHFRIACVLFPQCYFAFCSPLSFTNFGMIFFLLPIAEPVSFHGETRAKFNFAIFMGIPPNLLNYPCLSKPAILLILFSLHCCVIYQNFSKTCSRHSKSQSNSFFITLLISVQCHDHHININNKERKYEIMAKMCLLQSYDKQNKSYHHAMRIINKQKIDNNRERCTL